MKQKRHRNVTRDPQHVARGARLDLPVPHLLQAARVRWPIFPPVIILQNKIIRALKSPSASPSDEIYSRKKGKLLVSLQGQSMKFCACPRARSRPCPARTGRRPGESSAPAAARARRCRSPPTRGCLGRCMELWVSCPMGHANFDGWNDTRPQRLCNARSRKAPPISNLVPPAQTAGK